MYLLLKEENRFMFVLCTCLKCLLYFKSLLQSIDDKTFLQTVIQLFSVLNDSIYFLNV